jgi:hypothetical protein
VNLQAFVLSVPLELSSVTLAYLSRSDLVLSCRNLKFI